MQLVVDDFPVKHGGPSIATGEDVSEGDVCFGVLFAQRGRFSRVDQ